MKNNWIFNIALACLCLCASRGMAGTLVEAESFAQKGGWCVDQQFMDIMKPGEAGSVILLAHGMGKPVENAKTSVKLDEAGVYNVFVRTRNWASPWMPKGLDDATIARDWAPGKFRLILNGTPSDTVLGIQGSGWAWHRAGSVTTTATGEEISVELQDLTGFDGRADALYFTREAECDLPADPAELVPVRRSALNLPEKAPNAREKAYDLVVVGGGIAGTCAAVAAAKLGLDVALIQDRPVLGGNGSTEIRVHLNGGVNLPPYPNLGNLTFQMGPHGGGNAREAGHYKDVQRLDLCEQFANLDLYLSTHVMGVEKNDSQITAVIGKHIETGVETRFAGKLFADCTGDAVVGYLAGADWHMGREARAEFDEPSAPETADKLTMGASIQWYTLETDQKTEFPELPWAHQFSAESIRPMIRGDWDWETGLNFDQVWEFERIRDNGLRAAYGHWSYMKNHMGGTWADSVKNRELGWMAYLAGKRESRRLMGDVVLREQDVTGDRQWEDGCVPCTWSIDLHYPHPDNTKFFAGEEFRSIAKFGPKPPHYAIPYRTLYSRNVSNLFMAGRNISVTHISLGTVRVMRTGGMMGEVVGMAASVCRKHDVLPRAAYENHLDELKALWETGVAEPPAASVLVQTPKWLPKDKSLNLARSAKVVASNEHSSGLYPVKNINDGVANVRENTSRWVSVDGQRSEREETWVEFTWDAPVTMNSVRIVSGFASNRDPKDPIDNFVLQRFENGRWVDIPQAGVKNNVNVDFGVQFPAVTTDRIRFFVNSPGYIARLWEVEFYNLSRPEK